MQSDKTLSGELNGSSVGGKYMGGGGTTCSSSIIRKGFSKY